MIVLAETRNILGAFDVLYPYQIGLMSHSCSQIVQFEAFLGAFQSNLGFQCPQQLLLLAQLIPYET